MAAAIQCLLCQVEGTYLALPIAHVIEVSRPLPLTRVADAPPWLSGVCVMRGGVTPVVDARRLLGGDDATNDNAKPSPSLRWVSLRVEQRRVALAVDAVLQAGPLPQAEHPERTPLVASSPLFSALGTLDSKLLLVLQEARLLGEDALSVAEAHARGR